LNESIKISEFLRFIRETQIFRALPAGALAFSQAGGEAKKNLLVEQLSEAFSRGEAE
jgi:hypothetical protein